MFSDNAMPANIIDCQNINLRDRMAQRFHKSFKLETNIALMNYSAPLFYNSPYYFIHAILLTLCCLSNIQEPGPRLLTHDDHEHNHDRKYSFFQRWHGYSNIKNAMYQYKAIILDSFRSAYPLVESNGNTIVKQCNLVSPLIDVSQRQI